MVIISFVVLLTWNILNLWPKLKQMVFLLLGMER